MSMSASLVRISALTSFIALTASPANGAPTTKPSTRPPTRPPTREECIEGHGEGQDAREAGQLTQASRLFLACAHATCPALVQSDCARFAEELERLQPTVTFAARDSAQNDLQDTSVFVDGKLVASRLGEGKAYEVDPGRHEVRFVHAGTQAVLDVVVNQGEKGRGIVGVFPSPPKTPARAAQAHIPARPAASASGAIEPERPAGPLILAGLGAAAAVAGGVIMGVGFAQIPAPCSLSTNECAAAPDDPVLDQASSAVTTANIGVIVGAGGVLTLAGSLFWYFSQSRVPSSRTTEGSVLPWIGPQSAGLSFTGSL